MQQYQEDSLGVLDIGKEFAKASLLPWERMKYDASVWNMQRGGLNVAAINPLRRGGLINNGMTRGIAKGIYRDLGGITKKFGWSSTLQGSESVKDIRSTVGKLRKGINVDFDTGLLQMKDGILSASKMKIKDTSWHQGNKSKIADIESKLHGYSSKVNSNFRRMGILRTEISELINNGPNAADRDLIKQKVATYRQRALSNTTRSAKATFGQKFFGGGFRSQYKVEADLTRSLRYAKRLSFGADALTKVGRGAIKIGALAGWASAMYAVGSLMYEGIKMVANPVAQAGVRAVDQTFSSLASIANPELGGQLELGFLSQGAATERQRAVQAISKSRINGRSMLGNEGAMMHR